MIAVRPTCSLSSTAARNSAISGAMKVSATACAIGTRASPQKKAIAITAETEPRIRWTRITDRAGQAVRVATNSTPLIATPAKLRHTRAL